MEISEEQRKLAIFNARKLKQGKIKGKSRQTSGPLDGVPLSFARYSRPHLNPLPCSTRFLSSYWLLRFGPAPPPKPPPEPPPPPPASRYCTDQRAPATRVLIGRAPQAKACPPVALHHTECPLQEVIPRPSSSLPPRPRPHRGGPSP